LSDTNAISHVRYRSRLIGPVRRTKREERPNEGAFADFQVRCGLPTAQQDLQRLRAFSVAFIAFPLFAQQGAGGLIRQLRGNEDVNHTLRFVTCLQIALDKHLNIAANGTVFEGSYPLDTVPRSRIEANRDAGARWGFCFAHER
jgi:hypothetical protein